MLKLAVVGKDVSQSISPPVHKFILSRLGEDCTYEKLSIPPAEFSARAEELFARYDGFNVTIPYKAEILPYLKGLQGDGLSFGVVNTVLTKERLGDNTDGFGFMTMLENEGVFVKGKRVLVLGAGGAGRSCIKKLAEAGAEVFAFSRTAARVKQVYDEFGCFTPLSAINREEGFDAVINCTGIGMHDTVGQTPNVLWTDGSISPVGEEFLSRCQTAIDLIYVPKQSEFLRIAKGLGKRTINGEAMLFYQAYLSDCIYLRRKPDRAEAKALWEEYQKHEGEKDV